MVKKFKFQNVQIIMEKLNHPYAEGKLWIFIYKEIKFWVKTLVMAKSNLMIDNAKTRVTMWSFEIDDETGQHIHEYDYVIVPMLDGDLKIVDNDGSVSISNLKKGECYFREKGVNHNVINNNKFPYSFIEVEIKN